MRTIVYIDGFNLYYRMLKDKPASKWINPKALAEAVLNSQHVITRVNYYTARISSQPHNIDAPARQALYLKALSSVPEIAVHEGTFMTSKPWMRLATPPRAKPDTYVWNQPAPALVRVIKSEEKGSDVNLGVHLVRDALTNAFDVAVVLTNDSDLVEPIRIAVQEAGKRVGLLVPVGSPTQSLVAVASFYLHIRPGHLSAAQFPDPVTFRDGSSVARPITWI